MKAAIYARVSTEDQMLETQIINCTKYCESKDWDYDVFSETMSGSKQNRTELDRMLIRMRQGHYGVVVVWKLDRLGRSLRHLLQLLEEFRNKNVILAVTTMGLNTDKPEGRFFFQIIGAVAELEREMIRERIKAGLATKKAQGIQLGRPKGAKDKKPRRKSGYVARWANQPRKNQSWYQKEKQDEKAELNNREVHSLPE